METILNKINKLNFTPLGDELPHTLKSAYNLIADQLTEEEKNFLLNDLNFYLTQKGTYRVHNTFAGGIIFLREPETINCIKIEFNSNLNEARALVEYASEMRNARNVKYKPEAGKIESKTWNMSGIFPKFNMHNNSIRIFLMAIIGNIVKHICEFYKKESWFMEFEKPFEIELLLDGKSKLKYKVEIL